MIDNIILKDIVNKYLIAYKYVLNYDDKIFGDSTKYYGHTFKNIYDNQKHYINFIKNKIINIKNPNIRLFKNYIIYKDLIT